MQVRGKSIAFLTHHQMHKNQKPNLMLPLLHLTKAPHHSNHVSKTSHFSCSQDWWDPALLEDPKNKVLLFIHLDMNI